MAIRTIINIKRNEYDSFVSLIGTDVNLPADYEDWKIKRTKHIENYSSGIETLQFVTVDYNFFVKNFCASVPNPTYHMLCGYFGGLVTQGRWKEDVNS